MSRRIDWIANSFVGLDVPTNCIAKGRLLADGTWFWWVTDVNGQHVKGGLAGGQSAAKGAAGKAIEKAANAPSATTEAT